MKKYTIAVTAISLLFIRVPSFGLLNLSSIYAAQKLLLADRHKGAGITCEGCHQEDPPQKRVPMGMCTGCHGDALKIAERTNKSDVNPHDSHVGVVECDSCHHSHKPFENFCSKCHDFELKEKE